MTYWKQVMFHCFRESGHRPARQIPSLPKTPLKIKNMNFYTSNNGINICAQNLPDKTIQFAV